MDILKNLYDHKKHIQSMDDSVNYINDRLSTYYNTDKEKDDIGRNVAYLETMLTKDFIVSHLTQEKINIYKETIDKGRSTTSND